MPVQPVVVAHPFRLRASLGPLASENYIFKAIVVTAVADNFLLTPLSSLLQLHLLSQH